MKSIEQGYSLLELMIAISLSLFLSIGMFNIFIYSKNIYRLTMALNEIQNKIRLAFHLMSHDIRMAGFIGCVPLMDFSPLKSHLTINNRLVVWHKGNTTAKLSLPRLARYQNESDAILVQFLDPNTIQIKKTQSDQIFLSSKVVFRPNDVLIVSDCLHAELIHWRHIHLRYQYYLDSEIGFFNKIIYYIGDTGRFNESGQRIYALYRRNLNQSIHKPIELIEGIKNMSIRLGMKHIDGTLYYKNANEVKHWSNVRSVEIRLLLTDEKGQLQKDRKQIIGLRQQ
jgi:type IV pilus assembly protein PilW